MTRSRNKSPESASISYLFLEPRGISTIAVTIEGIFYQRLHYAMDAKDLLPYNILLKNRIVVAFLLKNETLGRTKMTLCCTCCLHLCEEDLQLTSHTKFHSGEIYGRKEN